MLLLPFKIYSYIPFEAKLHTYKSFRTHLTHRVSFTCMNLFNVSLGHY